VFGNEFANTEQNALESDVKLIYLWRKQQNNNAMLAFCSDGKKKLIAEHQGKC
jgi:hypothetical protein